MNADVAIGIDRSVERVVTKFLEVVGQQFLRLDIDVVGHLGQLLVVDASCEYGLMVVDVVDVAVDELDLVRYHAYCVIAQFVVASQCTDMNLSVQRQFSGQVDGVQRSCQLDGSVAVSRYAAEETAGERLGKVQVSALRTNVQIDVVVLG